MAIRDMNGWWEKLFKLFLSTFGILLVPHISWVCWVTGSVFMMTAFMHSGERYTQHDARGLEIRIQRAETDLEHIKGDLDEMQSDIKDILAAVRK